MKKLLFASLVTFTILFSFIFGLVMLVLILTESIDIIFAVILTVAISVFFWYIGPFFTDLINRWVYKVKFVTPEELEKLHPEVAKLIRQVCEKYKFRFPKFGIIPDRNPTAFSYGSGRFNSRIVVTEGIFEFLNTKEANAVVAHELGHIVHRDFIVMMIASTILQIIYEIYAVAIRVRDRKSGGAAKLIALVAYVMYVIGIYLLYYLSRTREYYADEFSAEVTSPKDLADALVKIAYGIVVVPDDAKAKRLLESTRHLGIIDVKNAKHIGVASQMTNSDPQVISEVMVFDKISPWAKLIELNSTHPLTGNRLDFLSDLSKKHGYAFSFDIDGAIARLKVQKSKLYGGFFGGVFVYLLPFILLGLSIWFLPIQFCLAAFALGLLAKVAYKFPQTAPQKTTILDQMRNPYASPIRGAPIMLSGEVIGRGVPGYIFGEDMMFKDATGLTFLNYNSLFGFIGNIFFALGKIKTLFSVPSEATGWFYRSMGSFVSLKTLKTEKETVKSHPIIWSLIFPILLIGGSAYWYLYVPMQ